MRKEDNSPKPYVLQVLDDGRLTDNKGRTVNFKNTIIIMTSNAPRESLMNIFRPEFLNRVDEIIDFTPLGEAEIRQIVKLQIDRVVKMVADNGITLHVDDKAIDLIAKVGYDPQFGARPVKRAIQEKMLNELSKKMLSGEIDRDKEIEVSADGDQLIFESK